MPTNIDRMIVNICTDDVQAIKDFYKRFFKFDVTFESDWYV
jgi:predicted enzyme related to lactoylglutathione lyase